MKTTRLQILIAAALAVALLAPAGLFAQQVPLPRTAAHAKSAANEKAAPAADDQSAYATAVEAYIRFLPRFYSFGFEKLMTAVPEPLTRPGAPLNQVGYRRSLVTPDLLFIVRPNNDTIYGAGYIDPSAEPILIKVPEAGKRFWSIQLADPWTNIAPGIGSRSGSKPGLYAVVGPKWNGKLPEGATEVPLGEGHYQIVFRVGYSSFANQTETDADLQKAVETLHGFVVMPLSKFSAGAVPDRAPNSKDAPQPPTSLRAITAGLAERRPLTLLALIRDAVKDPATPLDDEDRALLARFDQQLTKALAEFESSQSDQTTAAAMARGLHDARALIDERVRTSKRGDNGWATIKAGEWGNKYLDRAAIADYAIYANRAKSSMYPEIHVDNIGDPLDGGQRYTLRFEKGQLPPVSDFWSITMYRGDTLTLAENPIKRYSIGDRTPGLKFADDGSLTIYIQKDSPGKDKESNWLPTPAGEFNLMCRFYGPQQAIIDGKYKLPPVKRTE
jgi:hypothetical protein